MPEVDGLEVISRVAEDLPRLPTVVVSGTGVLDDAVEAMRRGAWDYISKPIADMNEVAMVVERVLERARLIAERDQYQREIELLNASLEAEVERKTEDLRAQNRRLKALNRVAYAASHSLDIDTMLHRVLSAALTAVQGGAGVIHLFDDRTDRLYVAATRSLLPEAVEAAQAVPLGQGIAGRVARDGQTRTGTVQIGPDMAGADGGDGPISYIYVPLQASDGVMLWEGNYPDPSAIIGTMGLFAARESAFERYEEELLTTIGRQLGVAVTRARYAVDLRRANVQLASANEELRRLDTLREQFIQNVAHELRTPLSLVRGYIELLAQGDMDEAAASRAVQVANARVQELVELVEAITTLQDINARPLEMGPVSVIELIDTACRMTRQRALALGIDIAWCADEELPQIFGDFGRLTQALHQVLDNGCKFSPAGTTVEVTTSLSSDGDCVMISVEDQGIGIPTEEHERIFERFYQVDGSATRRYGGTGLGLALVKEVMEAHDGWVRIESEVDEGSTFTLGLPCDRRSREG
jgi:signal transduction histidine kinase